MTQHLKAGSVEGLVEKLEAAGVGSRELDREIMALSYRWDQRHIGATCWDNSDLDPNDICCPSGRHLDWVWVDPDADAWKTTARDGFDFTTSLDAALALAERVLPGKWTVSITQWPTRTHQEAAAGKGHWGPDHWRALFVEYEAPCRDTNGIARSAAISVCIAILRARLSPTLEGEG